jgi:hypothetical protein
MPCARLARLWRSRFDRCGEGLASATVDIGMTAFDARFRLQSRHP